MKPNIKVAAIGALLVILGFTLACANYSTATITPSPRATASQSASSVFKIDSLAINPAEVNAGVEALITARVTNTGSGDNRYYGKVRIDNIAQPSLPAYLFTKEVTIPSGASQLLSVVTSIRYPGKYQVTWGEIAKELVVNPEETNGSNSGTPSPTGITAPDFTGVDVTTGKPVSLKQYAGSAILLNFVNYGCDPSLNNKVSAQLLAIKQLYQQRGDFVPVSVFCGCCPPDVLRQFAKENDFNWPWLLDTDYSIVSKYNNYLRKYGYPTLIFIDKGQAISEVTGYTSVSALTDKLNKIAPVVTTR